MTELSFKTFVEFVEAVDRASRLGTDLSALQTRVNSLRLEAKELSEKNTEAAKAVDAAKAEAKKILVDVEASRLEGETLAKVRADKLIADGLAEIAQAKADASAKMTSLGVDISARQQRLGDVNAEVAKAEAKLAEVKAAHEAWRKAAQ